MKTALIGGVLVAGALLGAAPAQADVFSVCPSGNVGVVGGHTTCLFAENVQRAFYASGMANQVLAYSPVTGTRYVMTCGGTYTAYFDTGAIRTTTHCYGGIDAEVVIW